MTFGPTPPPSLEAPQHPRRPPRSRQREQPALRTHVTPAHREDHQEPRQPCAVPAAHSRGKGYRAPPRRETDSRPREARLERRRRLHRLHRTRSVMPGATPRPARPSWSARPVRLASTPRRPSARPSSASASAAQSLRLRGAASWRRLLPLHPFLGAQPAATVTAAAVAPASAASAASSAASPRDDVPAAPRGLRDAPCAPASGGDTRRAVHATASPARSTPYAAIARFRRASRTSTTT